MDYGHALSLLTDSNKNNQALVVSLLRYYKFDYMALIKHSEKYGKSESEGIVFAYKNFLYPPDDQIENEPSYYEVVSVAYRLARNELNKYFHALHDLGCAVVWPRFHKYEVKGESGRDIGVGADLWLFLPRNKPNDLSAPTTAMSPPLVVENQEGIATFLAYLLAKGYVTEADIPVGDANNPFGQQYLGRAQTKYYQDKVAAVLAP